MQGLKTPPAKVVSAEE
jgi:hypothetical protein